MGGRRDAHLFGERPSRIVVSVESHNGERLERMAKSWDVPVQKLGVAGGNRFLIGGAWDLPLGRVEEAWRGGLEKALR